MARQRNGSLIPIEENDKKLIVHKKSSLELIVEGRVSAAGDLYISPKYAGLTAYAEIYKRECKPILSEIHGEPELYVWLGVFEGYTSLEVSVVAHNLEEARMLAAKKMYADGFGDHIAGLEEHHITYAVGETVISYGDPDDDDAEQESLFYGVLNYIKENSGYLTTNDIRNRYGISEKLANDTMTTLRQLEFSGAIIQSRKDELSGETYWSVV